MDIQNHPVTKTGTSSRVGDRVDRITALEAEVAELRGQLATLTAQMLHLAQQPLTGPFYPRPYYPQTMPHVTWTTPTTQGQLTTYDPKNPPYLTNAA